MLGSKKHPRLTVVTGEKVGKTYSLRKGEYSLGSHKKCRIKISGEYVSELHARIQQNESGTWVLTNNSPNGTYVNQQKIDSVDLEKVCTIQIGAENSLEFLPSNYESGRREKNSTFKGRKTNKWILIVVGLAVLYLPLFLYLNQLGSELGVEESKTVITLSGIERVANASTEYLKSMQVDAGVQAAEGNDILELNNHNASLYDRFFFGQSNDEGAKKELVDKLVYEAKGHLISAHRYVQMELENKAIESLRRAMLTIPDHRNPTTSFAAKTLLALEGK